VSSHCSEAESKAVLWQPDESKQSHPCQWMLTFDSSFSCGSVRAWAMHMPWCVVHDALVLKFNVPTLSMTKSIHKISCFMPVSKRKTVGTEQQMSWWKKRLQLSLCTNRIGLFTMSCKLKVIMWNRWDVWTTGWCFEKLTFDAHTRDHHPTAHLLRRLQVVLAVDHAMCAEPIKWCPNIHQSVGTIVMPLIGCKTECSYKGLIHLGFICRSGALQCHGTSCHLPCHSQVVKNIARESNEAASGTLVCMTWRLCLSDRCMRSEHVLFWIVQHELSLQTRHFQLNNKSATGTPILHTEASFISAERGLHRGILSRTSLKCHNHFRSFLKLTIFIHKQLERLVAFSAVQNCKQSELLLCIHRVETLCAHRLSFSCLDSVFMSCWVVHVSAVWCFGLLCARNRQPHLLTLTTVAVLTFVAKVCPLFFHPSHGHSALQCQCLNKWLNVHDLGCS